MIDSSVEKCSLAYEAVIPGGAITVKELNMFSRYTPEEEILKSIPSEYVNHIEDTYYYTGNVPLIDIDRRKGDLVYESRMDDELSINGWVLEGPGVITFEDEKMIMKSEYEDNPGSGLGHFNLWNPVDFPKNFIAEFDFELLSKHGCAVLHFSAKGINGEDLFDPTLAERTGHFMQYIKGDINNYLLAFFYNRALVNIGRPYINLFKNPVRYTNLWDDFTKLNVQCTPESHGSPSTRRYSSLITMVLVFTTQAVANQLKTGQSTLYKYLAKG